jgi:hypothetical protein
MLPKNLKYQNKVESASANAYTSNIAPQNGTGPYSAGQTIIIRDKSLFRSHKHNL